MKAKLIKTNGNHYDLYVESIGLYTSTYQWTRNGNLLSIENCQAIERGYDLDELTNEWVFETNGHKWSNNDDTAGDNCSSFKAGFQKALELMGNKKFSEEDIRQTLYLKTGFDKDGFYFYKSNEEIIQSLQQTEWDVEIEMDILNEYDQPKLDADWCLILKPNL